MKRLSQIILIALVSSALNWQLHGQLTSSREGKPDPSFGVSGFASSFGAVPGSPATHSTRLVNGTVFHVQQTSGNFLVGKQLSNGQLDTTFGQKGAKLVQFPEYRFVESIAGQPDGKLLMAGSIPASQEQPSDDFFVSRLTADGEFDADFGTGGTFRIDLAPAGTSIVSKDNAHSVSVQPDGRIVIAGMSSQLTISTGMRSIYAYIVRLNSDGSLDNSFGTGGLSQTLIGSDVTEHYQSHAIVTFQHDGKILLGFGVIKESLSAPGTNSHRALIIRFLTNGSLDSTFLKGGVADITDTQSSISWLVSPKEVADGKILVLTGAATLLRLNQDGSLDDSFADGGRAYLGGGGWVNDFAVTSSGTIFVTRTAGRPIEPSGMRYTGMLQKLWPDGTPDPRFGVGGKVVIDLGNRDLFLHRFWIEDDKYLVITGGFGPNFIRQPFVARFFATRK